MAYDTATDPAWQALQKRVGDFLSELSAEFGPRECAHGNWWECEEEDCTFDKTRPKEGSMPMVTDWILCMAVPDMADPTSESAYTVLTAERQRSHVSAGLLHEALFG